MKKFFAAATLLVFILTSCSSLESKAEGRAKDMCKCTTQLGIGLDQIVRDPYYGLSEKLANCSRNVLKGMREDMRGHGKKEQNAYIKAFLKGLIDTECSDKLLLFYNEELLNDLIQILE